MMDSSKALHHKVEFFQALEAVWNDDQDEPDKEQSELRRRYRDAQLRLEASSSALHATTFTATDAQDQMSVSQEPVDMSVQGPMVISGDRLIKPIARVHSAPTPITITTTSSSAAKNDGDKAIQGTPLQRIAHLKARRPGLALTAKATSFIQETPAAGLRRNAAETAGSSMANPATLRRTATSPLLPVSSPLDNRDLQQSASLGHLRKSKRKRTSGGGPTESSTRDDAVPEARQVFKGMSFFYIPNDDVAPARRRRICIAQKFGAQWVRLPELATHVIVDNNLTYKDIETVVSPVVTVSDTRVPPAIVRENFQGDSVQIGFIVNPDQPKYHVRGCPLPAARQRNQDKGKPEAQDSAETPSELNTQRSGKTLQVQTHRRTGPSTLNQHTSPATPPREAEVETSNHGYDVEPLADNNIMSSHITPAKGNSDRSHTNPEKQSQGAVNLGLKDELSAYIEMMAQYRHLPLDEDEDDVASVMDSESPDSVNDDNASEEEQCKRKKRKAATKAPTGRKDNKWEEDRLACHRGGTIDSRGHTTVKADNPNARTIEILQSMCNYYSQIDDHWRATAYRNAINTLRQQPSKISTEKEAACLPGIGSRLAKKIEEIVTTDRLQRLEHALNEPLDKVLQLFLGIYGVGLVQARRWISRGYRTLDDLKRPEVKLGKNQRMGLEHYDDLNMRIPRQEVEALGSLIQREAARVDNQVELLVGGSYRRGASSCGDVDLIVTRKGTVSTDELVPFLERLIVRLTETGVIVATVAALHKNKSGASKWHGCCVTPPEEMMPLLPCNGASGEENQNYRPIWRRLDFLLVPESEYGAALIYFTGNDLFNRSIRLLASKKGMRLNQRGLYSGIRRGAGREETTDQQLIEGGDEKRIFEILGVKWREPWERWC